MRILLNDCIQVTADPHITLIVSVTIVNKSGKDFWISPGVDHIALGIEFDDWGSGLCKQEFLCRQIASIGDEYMVARVHTSSCNIPRNPLIWQRLRPKRIHFELRSNSRRLSSEW